VDVAASFIAHARSALSWRAASHDACAHVSYSESMLGNIAVSEEF